MAKTKPAPFAQEHVRSSNSNLRFDPFLRDGRIVGAVELGARKCRNDRYQDPFMGDGIEISRELITSGAAQERLRLLRKAAR